MSTMTKDDLPLLTTIGYGLGHVFNGICASMWNTYLLLFLQKVDKILQFFGVIFDF